MKTYLFTLIPLLVLCGTASFAGQDEPKPVQRTSFIESRQGNHPDGPDTIGLFSGLRCLDFIANPCRTYGNGTESHALEFHTH